MTAFWDHALDQQGERRSGERPVEVPSLLVRGKQAREVNWGFDCRLAAGRGEFCGRGIQDRVERIVVGSGLQEHGQHRLRARRADVHEMHLHRVHVAVKRVLSRVVKVELRKRVHLAAEGDSVRGAGFEMHPDLVAVVDDLLRHGRGVVDAEHAGEVDGRGRDIEGRLEGVTGCGCDGRPARGTDGAGGRVGVGAGVVPGSLAVTG